MVKKKYYIVYLKHAPDQGLTEKFLSFEHNIRSIHSDNQSYILLDYQKEILGIVPINNVLYIKKFEEDF